MPQLQGHIPPPEIGHEMITSCAETVTLHMYSRWISRKGTSGVLIHCWRVRANTSTLRWWRYAARTERHTSPRVLFSALPMTSGFCV